MFPRKLGIPLLLGAAVAVPYVKSNGTQGISEFWNSMSATSGESSHQVQSSSTEWQQTNTPPSGPGAELYPVRTPLEGISSVSLEEVFRFDITKEWVYQHWARKSTALSELGLYGVRIPLVTGTQLTDIAGSLTYFFDPSGRVQKITFKGNTGDTTQLVMLVMHRYGLQPQTSLVAGEQLFQVKRGSDVMSELRTRPSPVLWSSSPHNSFAVELQLQSPSAATPLPVQLPPLPEVKTPVEPTLSADEAAKKIQEETAANQLAAKKELQESFNKFFPRSRVPEDQIKNLDKLEGY
ncbi:DUF6690 family protein [Bythopirellula polymerisocia]|uniref:DUF6690 domain-containing protein n=1 Tax=Bythopirellula polymerisocia TaxID=2528003 RepID=A0A5C6CV44_9BACT|nr:DUF6690 family protein [Bythopirellula polymerisocia]TWU27311.1 hypothetical protein Pla144_20830 [Bythopirellula polymerisocia]